MAIMPNMIVHKSGKTIASSTTAAPAGGSASRRRPRTRALDGIRRGDGLVRVMMLRDYCFAKADWLDKLPDK